VKWCANPWPCRSGSRKAEVEGRVRRSPPALLEVIKARFPHLEVREQVESVSELSILNSLIPVVARVRAAASVERAVQSAKKKISSDKR